MSQTQNNPLLLDPSAMADNGRDPAALLAAAQVRAMTAPLPATKMSQTEHYVCSVLNHQMHRTDGKVIHFLGGHHATDEYHTARYLENEIAAGNGYIRKATADEVRNYNMRRDPTGTVAAELRPKLESEIRGQLEVELQMALAQKMDSMGVVMSPEQEEELKNMFQERQVASVPTMTQVDPNSDQAKLATASILEQLRSKTTPVKTDTATVFVPTSAPSLGGISGTDKMANAASSNSEGVKK